MHQGRQGTTAGRLLAGLQMCDVLRQACQVLLGHALVAGPRRACDLITREQVKAGSWPQSQELADPSLPTAWQICLTKLGDMKHDVGRKTYVKGSMRTPIESETACMCSNAAAKIYTQGGQKSLPSMAGVELPAGNAQACN